MFACRYELRVACLHSVRTWQHMEGWRASSVTSITCSCHHRRHRFITYTHKQPHTHTLSKLPPKYRHTHRRVQLTASTESALNDCACVCLSTCLHRQKLGPSPFPPALRGSSFSSSSSSSDSLSQQNTRSAPLSPACLLSLMLAGCVGA